MILFKYSNNTAPFRETRHCGTGLQEWTTRDRINLFLQKSMRTVHRCSLLICDHLNNVARLCNSFNILRSKKKKKCWPTTAVLLFQTATQFVLAVSHFLGLTRKSYSLAKTC